MGCDVAANSGAARAIFDRAAAVLGYDLLELQREGPEDVLRETEYSQPAIFTTNVALYDAVGNDVEPVVTAGARGIRFIRGPSTPPAPNSTTRSRP